MVREELSWITAHEMREVDRIMMEDLGVDLLQMMEQAGMNLARLSSHLFQGGVPYGKSVLVLAGRGGTGGGAMAGARMLANRGALVRVLLPYPPVTIKGGGAEELAILTKMNIPVDTFKGAYPVGTHDLIIDGLLGYSLDGAPRGSIEKMIGRANDLDVPILSLDLPSGLDATTGNIPGAVITADATMTLALPKKGLKSAGNVAGDLYLADIGVPPFVYEKLSPDLKVPPLFNRSPIVRLY